MGSGLPTPPRDDHAKPHASRKTTSGPKPMKAPQRSSKRAPASAHSPTSSLGRTLSTGESRGKRVWKACERCRMKKTKCDGEMPCRRCKDDGLVCTAGVRRKTEYKQIPRGYAEVLENTQFALVATIHKLYAMVRNSQPWELGEPDLNDRGQPVVHTIASKLGCIRPNSDIDMPIPSAFPEDEAGMADLIAQLNAQQQSDTMSQDDDHHHHHQQEHNHRYQYSDAEMEPELDMGLDNLDLSLSLDTNYRRMAFGGEPRALSAGALSPQSLCLDSDRPASDAGFSTCSPLFDGAAEAPALSPYLLQQPPLSADQFFHSLPSLGGGGGGGNTMSLKPVPDPEATTMMGGMGDPMIFSGYGPDLLSM
ncbi:hypothetical protein MCOR27_011468 [Pyricularia oryzae]|uniref:Zn(2)-C6 fungal-type domain-containing protein n=3 Tax=Pyricularia TaxID=48558 RepID=A0ABQ8N2G6_PYRGI|nr:hypothetical protein MCOR01_005163 [Pyricularia oryzae]KAI6290115.1 hypothetical protein MCOR33_011515 [Pyricularia grisea]KAI6252144.1 hypothetical protein MCOR19_011236 [Pyricularia oryzae]KAI6264546.1 hypothetical protein MCOR26_011276 [Pyricularia oryzae]KAI6265248.1 hypothetical protein MCOR27_011468 [Pyricularia oryzae]